MSSTISLFLNLSQQVVIYMNIPVLIVGVIGGIFNLIVFLSFKTFRQNSCSFYLMIMSWVNIGQLLTGNFTRIMGGGYNIDWTQNSLFYCKIRWYFIQLFILTSYACLCFATIDQYLATSSRYRWQQWSNIKLAYYLCSASFIFAMLHGIPSIIFYNYGYSIVTGQRVCTITNSNYQQYKTYGYFLILTGFLPIFITVLFGSLAYRNVQQIAYRTVPLVRRELDKQLTTMVLVQVVYSLIVIMPYTICLSVTTMLNLRNDPVIVAKLQFIEALAGAFYYSYFAAPFYIYICVSKRFRQQLAYVLSPIFISCSRRQPIISNNQVVPEINGNSFQN
ncbi:unnamed protein product [Rotaria sordida]|uniref:G-protein coupled receptors family 1 profile domain-containing protein n=1 Tax=Rotaria sordida TaxID=392033 RepID=A0A818VGU2_9BILA|nr:unnamed protein product [Rotaria sordida]